MSILNHQDPRIQLRPIQIKTLLEVEKLYNQYQVIVLNLPVASGKSQIGLTISKWADRTKKTSSALLVPNNLLLNQYSKDTLSPIMFGIYESSCKDKDYKSCGERKEVAEANNSSKKKKKEQLPIFCKDCPFRKKESRFYLNYQFNYITNFYKYLSLKKQFRNTAARDLLIIDEGHTVIDTLKELNTHYLWHHDFEYNKYPTTETLVEALKNTQLDPDGSNVYQPIITALSYYPPLYITKKETGILYRGEPSDRLVISPLTTDGIPNPLWGKDTKLIIMSATFGKEDIKELGLADRKWAYINADSIIPSEQRPVISLGVDYVKGVNLVESSFKLANEITKIAEHHFDEKGIIHATYAQAKELKKYLPSDRFLFHTRFDKKQVFNQYILSDKPLVLVASGMYEGIDLPYDKGRWQCIAKVPYLNLGEPSVKYKSTEEPDWYAWQAVKTLLQASGRICRGPDDYGVTYMLDSNFNTLYRKTDYMWPEWFKESVRFN